MDKQRLLSLFALFACFFALCVIGLGAFTRLIDAGLGCPDWPGCYGHLTVPMLESVKQSIPTLNIYKAWAEMVHRYFAGCLSLLTLGVILLAFVKPLRTRANIVFATLLLLLIAYQIILGQWTVTMKLLPIVVTQHLLGGFLILSVLWLVYLNNAKSFPTIGHATEMSGLLIGAIFGLVILLVQIFLGAWTSTNYASLSCPDFPFCVNTHPWQAILLKQAFNFFAPIGINYEGGVLPETVRQSIQITHRLGALMFTGYMLIFTIIAMPKLFNIPQVLKIIYLIWSLIFVQISLGIVNIVYKLPLVTAISHNIIAIVLLLSMITFIFNLVIVSRRVSIK